ncbi:hypothetical protein GCM10010954_17570 [Halobacillus andaensis]|uniref:Uncharacterized protein n=1 Tax=Halobacillus andaensis TaxID=1176239 RepID=A0A917B3I9_HALAA|nr:hypothetical protein [Halobacillus andaensis]MBP2004740.1 ABC-type multidrug transport system fused ATPase/permease subunit [Halobacillus andaensis]GGF19320.1 hypothetical protein GCM10010954_17570 [Halobacillus andaensis]
MNFSTWEVYRWVRSQRFKKKRKLYQQAFQLTFDLTLAIYAGVLGCVFLFILADWLNRFIPLLESWQLSVAEWVWVLPFALVLRACVQAFFHPGLAFTTSEMNISMLPHPRSHLLWHIAIVRGFFHTLGAFLLAFGIGWLTPFTFAFTFYIAAIFSLFFSLTILVQWKLFSLSRWKNLLMIGTFFLLIGILRYLTINFGIQEGFIGLTVGLLLLSLNIYLIPRGLKGVDWGRVVDVNDARVWNVQLISQMTKVYIKPPKRYGVLQTYLRTRRAKQRFTSINQLYHRLWRYYFHHQFGYVWKTMMICAAIIVILPIQTDWVMYITLPIAIFVYIEVAASLFVDQFREQPMLNILPVEEKGWRQTYFRWAALGSCVLFLLYFVATVALNGLYPGLMLQMIGLVGWSLLDLNHRLIERMNAFQRKDVKASESFRLIGYLFLGVGMYFPPAVLGVLVPLLLTKYAEKLPFLRPMT